MRETRKVNASRYALTALLGSFLVGYHLLSLTHREAYQEFFKWSPGKIEFRIGDRTYLSFQSPLGRKNLQHLDYASRFLSELGGSVFFLSGQVGRYAIRGKSHPFQFAFVREEARQQYSKGPEWVKKRYVLPIQNLLSTLKQDGNTVVVVPVPTKLSIERENYQGLPRWNWFEEPPARENAYADYRQLTESLSPEAIDLFQRYQNARSQYPGEYLYQPMDSHWTSLGAALAVVSIVDKLRERGWQLTPIEPVPRGVAPPAIEGDLHAIHRLPAWLSAYRGGLEWPHPLYGVTRAKGQLRAKRVLVLGSSYCGSPTQTPFTKLIEQAIDLPVVSSCSPGNYHHLDRAEKMLEQHLAIRPDDLVIFEFPYRFPWAEGEVVPALPRENAAREVAGKSGP